MRAALWPSDVIIAGWRPLWLSAALTQVENCFFACFSFPSSVCRVTCPNRTRGSSCRSPHPRLPGCGRPLGTCAACFQLHLNLFAFFTPCVFQSGLSLAEAELLGAVCCFIPQSHRLTLRGQASQSSSAMQTRWRSTTVAPRFSAKPSTHTHTHRSHRQRVPPFQ